MCFIKHYCYFFFVALIITAAAAGAFQYTSYERRRRNVSGLSRKCGSDVYAVDTTITSLSATLKPCFQYVAKTTESFKFADLYWLQANVMAYSENSESTVEKLAFHRPTASLLLGYNKTSSSSSDHQELPFPSDRVQYVGRVIASGVNAQELLASIRATSTCNCFWTLDYDTFEPLTGRQFTTSMLMCAVSRHLSGEPLLGRNDSDDATISYLLVESSSKLYLIEKLSVNNQMHEMYQDDVSRFRQEWSRRPFQYSGAVNIEIAITVIDMLQRLQPKNREDLKDNSRIRVLDPTVGSGTFLAAAAKLWNSRKDENGSLDIVGIDSNYKCSEGTIHNLRKLFGVECIAEEEEFIGKSWAFNNSRSEMDSRATIYCGDSVELISSTSLDGALFDCVVSNLPWNRNTYEYKQDTGSCTRSEIMRRLPEVLKPGKPVIVVSGSNDLTDSFNAKCSLLSMGFSVIGEVTIPPAGFSLPDSVKNKKKSIEATRPAKRNSDCVVTVAIAPKH